MIGAVVRPGGRGLRPHDHPADRHGDGFSDPPPSETFLDELARLPLEDLSARAVEAPPSRVDQALRTDAMSRTLQEHVKSRLAPYKYTRWIEFRRDLPKTATGKIQRFKLRAEGAAR